MKNRFNTLLLGAVIVMLVGCISQTAAAERLTDKQVRTRAVEDLSTLLNETVSLTIKKLEADPLDPAPSDFQVERAHQRVMDVAVIMMDRMSDVEQAKVWYTAYQQTLEQMTASTIRRFLRITSNEPAHEPALRVVTTMALENFKDFAKTIVDSQEHQMTAAGLFYLTLLSGDIPVRALVFFHDYSETEATKFWIDTLREVVNDLDDETAQALVNYPMMRHTIDKRKAFLKSKSASD